MDHNEKRNPVSVTTTIENYTIVGSSIQFWKVGWIFGLGFFLSRLGLEFPSQNLNQIWVICFEV